MKISRTKSVSKEKANIENFYIWLDLFRWVAAFEVVLFHINHRFFLKLTEIPVESRDFSHTLYAAVSSFGVPAVIVFFVLSGYLVGGLTANKFIKTGNFDFKTYTINRVTRLWIVLIPAIIFTYSINLLIVDVFNGLDSKVYGPNVKLSDFVADSSIDTAICNIFFMQGVICTTYGYDGALWSLFHEFWYYVTFPLLMVAIWGGNSIYVRILCGVAFTLVLYLLQKYQLYGPNVFMYSGVWVMGAFAGVYGHRVKNKGLLWPTVLFVTSLIIWRLAAPKGVAITHDSISFKTLIDYVPGVFFTFLLICLKNNLNAPRPPFGNLNKTVASYSFSLYLIHTPLINLFGAIFVFLTGSQYPIENVNVKAVLMAIICAILCMILSYLFASITERHTDKVRSYILSLNSST